MVSLLISALFRKIYEIWIWIMAHRMCIVTKIYFGSSHQPAVSVTTCIPWPLTHLCQNISRARPNFFLAEGTFMTSLKPPVVSVVLLVTYYIISSYCHHITNSTHLSDLTFETSLDPQDTKESSPVTPAIPTDYWIYWLNLQKITVAESPSSDCQRIPPVFGGIHFPICEVHMDRAPNWVALCQAE